MSKIYSIKCSKCAAPLNILGGGRVKTVTCKYCKSQLDLTRDYKIVARYTDTIKDDTIFKVGMKGKIEGIEWTIIGFIVYKTKEDEDYTWNEFLLFSKVYGYAWLVYEYGKVYFSRRVRDINLSNFSDGKYTIFYKNGHYILENNEPYISIVEYVQGEMTSIIKRADEAVSYDYKGVDGQSITIEKNHNEIEAYYSKELNTEKVFNSFGITKDIDKPINPITRKKYFKTIISLIVILFLLIIYSFISNKDVLSQKIDTNSTIKFKIHNGAFLTKIMLKSPAFNTLEDGELVLCKGDKEYLRVSRNFSVYKENKSFNGTFKAFSIGANIYIKLDKGNYKLKLQNFKKVSSVYVDIESFIIKDIYLIISLVLLFFGLIYFGKSAADTIILIIKILVVIFMLLASIYYDNELMWMVALGIIAFTFTAKGHYE